MSDRLKWLMEELPVKENELRELNAKLDVEKRMRNDDEKAKYKELSDAINELRSEIKEKQEEEARSAKKPVEVSEQRKAAFAAGGEGSEKKEDSEQRDILKLSRSINSGRILKIIAGNERMDGAEREVTDEAIREARQGGSSFSYKGVGIPGSVLRAEWLAAEKRTDIDQTTSAIQPTVVGSYVAAIRQDAVFSRVIPSSNILTGLTADYKIPAVGSQSLAWATAESSAAADGGANYTKDTLAPIRLTGYADISNRVILQNGEVAMNAVMADFGRETANKIDAALFSTANVTNAIPAIAATSGVNTFTEAATYAAPSSSVNGTVFSDYLEALQTLANVDSARGALAFVGHTKLFSDLVKSPQVLAATAAAGMPMYGAPLMINMNGIPFYLTTSNTSNGTTSADFIGGDFNFQYVGFFGGLDMSLDPYSVKLNDEIRIVVHRNIDATAIRGAAFVKSTTLLA